MIQWRSQNIISRRADRSGKLRRRKHVEHIEVQQACFVFSLLFIKVFIYLFPLYADSAKTNYRKWRRDAPGPGSGSVVSSSSVLSETSAGVAEQYLPKSVQMHNCMPRLWAAENSFSSMYSFYGAPL